MYISSVIILLPLTVGAIVFKWHTEPLRWLYWLIIVGTAFELCSFILNINGVKNLFLFHFFTVVEFSFLSIVFRTIFQDKKHKRLVGIVSIPFTIYFIGSLFVNDLTRFDDYNKVIESFILVGYCLLYITAALNRLKAPYLEMHPYFILISTLLIYFVGTAFIFLVLNQLDKDNFMIAWTVFGALNIILKIVYTSVLWKSRLTFRT